MSTQDERRETGGQRIPFEALVVVADDKSDKAASPYECEAVDLSEHGMHLRTAYLPELGQALTFRFDGGLGEVVAEATVLWRDEQAKGGEFGVRFTRLDDASLRALRDICGIEASGPETKASGFTPAPKGNRVRLHIDGLGSPMRARVRDSATAQVLVGSNLEFLKVGKALDLEDAELGKKRPAVVERVEVEVDQETKIPQLIVRLRYGDLPKELSDAEKLDDGADAPRGAEASPTEDEEDDLLADKPTALDAISDRAKALALAVGPRLSSLGKSARAGFGGLVARVREKRADQRDDDVVDPKKRVTSPPPRGALRANGRAVTRGEKGDREMTQDEEALDETDDRKQKERRRAKIFAGSAAAFLVLMIALFALRTKSSPPPGDAHAEDASAAAPPPPTPPVGAAASGEAVSANVPLFGPTPLSTTEVVPPPAGAVAPGAQPSEGSEGDETAQSDEPMETTFGKGAVRNPKIVRIKMDAPITGLKGATDKRSITISLAGRRNIEPAGNLARKDSRLSAVKAVSRDGGIDVVYTFKDAVPPFMAKVDGKYLVMELGEPKKASADAEEREEKTAKKGSKKGKKSKAVATHGKKKGKKSQR